MRFLLDEHVPRAVADGLRRRDIDVFTIIDAGLRSESDADILAWAAANHRVVVTFDSDFLTLHTESPDHAGIVWCHYRKSSVRQIIEHLSLINAVLAPEDLAGKIEFL